MVRRRTTPSGRKSPVLFMRVRPKDTTHPYVAVITGRHAGHNAKVAKREVMYALAKLANEGLIPGAETIRVSYQRSAPKARKETTE